jgi:hypothetical protein
MNGIFQADPGAQTDPVEPLIGVLGYLTELVRLSERAGPLEDPNSPRPLRLILHQCEIENTPGVRCNSL